MVLDSAIINRIIFNYFKYSRISCSLDGSGDVKFRGFEDIEKKMILFKLKIMMSFI